MCNSCGQHNFRSRAECYKCAAPKCVTLVFCCLAVLRLRNTNTACLRACHRATAGIQCKLRPCCARCTGQRSDSLASGLAWVAKGHANRAVLMSAQALHIPRCLLVGVRRLGPVTVTSPLTILHRPGRTT